MHSEPSHFQDRAQAGERLAQAIMTAGLRPTIIYALPRGGVPVAQPIARALGAPLELALVRKIGAPRNPELAVGAVSDGEHPHLVVNADIARTVGADPDYLRRQAALELVEIARRRRLYGAALPGADPTGRTVAVVDDGLATGATAKAAIQALRRRGAAHIILATPVAAAQAAERLRHDVDDLVCLVQPADFSGVGQFYADFHQLTDAEVIAILREAAEHNGGQSARP